MHALLVTAYKDFPALERLVKKSDPRFFVIFIHIDIQSSINGKQIDRLRELGCLVSRIYKIRWGEINHLYAILHLLGQALKRSDIEYIHLISGEDYPLGTLEDFRIKCDGRIFMGFEVLSAAPQDIRDRYQFYNIFYFLLGK